MSSLEVSIDLLLKNYTGKSPGAAISIIKNGNAFTKCYGIANMETGTPVNTKTNFRLASITKQFTAMCILMLAEKSKLSLDNKLRDLIPEFPSYADKLTIKNMLHHTSGIARSLIPKNFSGQIRDRDILRLYIKKDSTEYEPGTKMQYSNDAYVLLGIIIERVTGITLSDYMEREIFKKIGMKNTVLHNEGVTTIPNRAYGYAKLEDTFGFSDQSQTSLVLGDGGIYSNLDDMFLWDQTLYTDRLVSKKMITEAFTSGETLNGKKINYGYGWYLEKLHGYNLMFHSGSTSGFANFYVRIPEVNFSIVLLTNRRGNDLYEPPDKTSEKSVVKYLINKLGSDIIS